MKKEKIEQILYLKLLDVQQDNGLSLSCKTRERLKKEITAEILKLSTPQQDKSLTEGEKEAFKISEQIRQSELNPIAQPSKGITPTISEGDCNNPQKKHFYDDYNTFESAIEQAIKSIGRLHNGDTAIEHAIELHKKFSLPTKQEEKETDDCWNCGKNASQKITGCCNSSGCGCIESLGDPPFCSSECHKEYYTKQEEGETEVIILADKIYCSKCSPETYGTWLLPQSGKDHTYQCAKCDHQWSEQPINKPDNND